MFGVFTMNSVVAWTCLHIMSNWHHLLFPGDLRSIRDNMKHWAEKIKEHVGATEADFLVFAFVDGTAHRIARPGGHTNYQRCVYDGHHRCHAFDYQAVMAPNGLIIIFFGTIPARYPDTFVWGQSHVADILRDMCKDEAEQQYWIYGDKGYTSSDVLGTPIRDPVGLEAKMNQCMASVRIISEWQFGTIKNKFQALEFTRHMKVFKSLVGVWYPVCVLLTNCYTCMNENENKVREMFGCDQPDIREYLRPRDAEFERWAQKYRPTSAEVPVFGDKDWYESNRNWAALYVPQDECKEGEREAQG